MLAVIDTSYLLRMAAARERSAIFAAWLNRRFMVAMSEELMAELTDVMSRPKTQRFLPEAVGHWFLVQLRSRAVWVTPASESPHCRDPKDDIVIATAVAAHADFIVTTDYDLLDDPNLVEQLTVNWGIRVVLPPMFLMALG